MAEEIQIEQIKSEILSAAQDMKLARQEMADEVKRFGSASAETKAEFDKLQLRMDDLEAQLKKPAAKGNAYGDGEQKSLAEEFMATGALQEWRDRGHDGRGFSVKLARSFFPESLIRRKATVLSTGVPGSDQWLPGIQAPLVEELRIRDLMTVVPTTESVIKFVRELAFTDGTSPQVEGEAKGESSITFEDAEARVRTIATWLAVSKQAIDDNDRLQAYLEGRLRYRLKLKEESQILGGDGTGENLDGIIPQATAYDGGGIATAGDTPIDIILNAATQLRLANAPHEGTCLNPIDYGKIRKVKTDEGTTANRGSYLVGNPGADPFLSTMLWGRPCVVTTSIEAGTFLVGAFRTFAQLHDRQQIQVDVSASHDDFFVKNKFAIRVEERLAVLVLRPEAFIYGSF
jgi:HK97 family phage major capsid protein